MSSSTARIRLPPPLPWSRPGVMSVGAVPATVVLGMGADKDARAFLTALRPLIGHLIVTRADSPRAANPDIIAQAAAALGIPHEVQPSVAAAVEAAKARDTGPILITGSLFVVGEGREAFGLAEPDLDWLALNRAAAATTDSRSAHRNRPHCKGFWRRYGRLLFSVSPTRN